MKRFLAGFLTAYLFAGITIGLGLKKGSPATNYFGVAYIAVIWPAWMQQMWTGIEVPVPSWSWTFSDKESLP